MKFNPASIINFIKNNKKYIALFLFIHLSMLSFYWVTSIGAETYRLLLHARRFVPCAIGVTFAIHLWKKYSLPWFKLVPSFVVASAWFFFFNITSYLTNYKISTNLNNFMDITFAAYILFILIFLHVILLKSKLHLYKVTYLLFSLLQILLLLIPITGLAYYFYYGTTLSTAAAIAVLQTNPKEAWEYLQQTGITSIAAIIALLVFLSVIFYNANSIPATRDYIIKFTNSEKYTSIALLLVMLFYLPNTFSRTGIIRSFTAAHSYLSEARDFQKRHQQSFAKLDVQKSHQSFSKPSSIFLVIGESYGRNFMSAYGYTNNDTTPWLKDMIQNDNQHFLRFNHAYSTFGSTIQSLEHSLTQKNQYNNINFKDAVTLIDLAKKAGYKTYWFSNQGVKNTADTPIQLVARTADMAHWIENDPIASERALYDEDLLPCLKRVNPNDNNFIVVHVMGCHELTIHRFPEDRTRFGQKGVFDLIPNYEDAMAYNDWVLQKVYEYGKDNLNLQAMVIFSDHGANPYRKRTAENIPFINVRIPLIIYLSDEYQNIFPETTKALKTNLDKYYSNDLMFETIGGLLNISSNTVKPEFSITSSNYCLTRETVKTDLGRKNVKDDLHEDEIEY